MSLIKIDVNSDHLGLEMLSISKILVELFEADYENDSGQPFWGNVAAGILPISTSTQRILVAYRSKYVNEPHTWGVIGGKLDSGDDIKSTAMREFDEETGYSGHIEMLPGYVFRTSGFEYHNFIGILDDEFTPRRNWETEKFEWVTYDELMELSPKHFGLKSLLGDSKSLAIIKKYSGLE